MPQAAFDRAVAVELRVASAIRLAHAASAKGGEDFVRAEARAGIEGQTIGIIWAGRLR